MQTIQGQLILEAARHCKTESELKYIKRAETSTTVSAKVKNNDIDHQ